MTAAFFATAGDISGSTLSGNTSAVTLGSSFTFASGGVITSLRLYANVAGTYKARLQDASGNVLATAANQVVSAPGWVTFPIAPVAVAPGIVFVVAGFFPSGQWRQIAMAAATVRNGITWQGSGYNFAADISNPVTSDPANYYMVDVGYDTVPTKLVHFKLDDSTGSSVFSDATGYGRPATVNGAPTFGGSAAALGIPGSSVAFASPGGVHQYGAIVVPPWLKFVREISIKGWFKTTNTGNLSILSMDNVFSSPGSADRKLNLYMSSGKLTWMSFTSAGGFPYAETPGVYNNGVWHQVWATRSTSALKIYVDGVLIVTQTISGTLSGSNVNLIIAQVTGLLQEFIGSLDDIEIWSGVKTDADVAASFASEIASPLPTQGFWGMLQAFS